MIIKISNSESCSSAMVEIHLQLHIFIWLVTALSSVSTFVSPPIYTQILLALEKEKEQKEKEKKKKKSLSYSKFLSFFISINLDNSRVKR